MLYFSKSAVREDIVYKGLKEIFHPEGYERVNIASIVGSVSPYGVFPGLASRGILSHQRNIQMWAML